MWGSRFFLHSQPFQERKGLQRGKSHVWQKKAKVRGETDEVPYTGTLPAEVLALFNARELDKLNVEGSKLQAA